MEGFEEEAFGECVHVSVGEVFVVGLHEGQEMDVDGGGERDRGDDGGEYGLGRVVGGDVVDREPDPEKGDQ
ncbi:hypothetical protein [Bifidobacterium callitrichos]|uniref:hypothetical protein n=1 Tax=Bifidobacterium callitrichos TaxID=762209 RepID=UPI0012E0444A|nr:hypothetical protein [Bifidobacterium callitrichos]